MNKYQEALNQVVPGTILLGNFPMFNPITMEQLPMTMPVHLVSDCVMCSIGKPEITKNITEINIPIDGGYKTIWRCNNDRSTN